jgi:hypothetical protein
MKSDQQIEQQDKARAKRDAKRQLPAESRAASGVADWANADPGILLQLICAVGMEGGAVRCGYTRDGGAYSVGLYLGTDSKTYYCNDKDGINDKLKELLEYFTG